MLPNFRIVAIAAVIFAAIIVLSQAQVNIVEYRVTVEPVNCSKAVTVYVPVVLKEDGTIHDVMENLAVNGTKVMEIVETEHGKMLKIVTKNRTTVMGYYSHRVPIFSKLDVVKPSTAEVKSYYEPTEVYAYMSGDADRVSLKFEIWAKWSGLTLPMHTGYVWGFWLNGHLDKVTLKEGWNNYTVACMVV
ncbi:hypothetical protein [Archaeoglobus neptunius]|uniref:hypothetical protein n=1 Tax=Archaeoglobus neptunius TaxID=2798580 RepID=UPI00192970CE|nr:hypothetical protein [Archaeoglobus neptunius]